MKNDSSLFYTCSLIEFIGRTQKLKRSDVVNILGEKVITHIYKYSDILHCEPIAKVAEDFIKNCKVTKGNFDNVSKCKYLIPDYWDIGEVYSRVIEDTEENADMPIKNLIRVYLSPLSDWISNYNSDFYYQPRDYIKECYLANKILE